MACSDADPSLAIVQSKQANILIPNEGSGTSATKHGRKMIILAPQKWENGRSTRFITFLRMQEIEVGGTEKSRVRSESELEEGEKESEKERGV